MRGLRSSSGAPHDLEQAFSGMPEELAIAEHAEYRVIIEGQARPLNPMIRDEVYRIGREALVNAFRHSGARHVEIELEYAPSDLRLFVRDDGRGIDPQVLRPGSDGHWGIAGMRERAESIGAGFKVRSRAAAGTEVELAVPGPSPSSRHVPARPRCGIARLSGWAARHRPGTERSTTYERSAKIRVFSVDDHPLLREGIAAIINNQPDMAMVAQASTGREAIQLFASTGPT